VLPTLSNGSLQRRPVRSPQKGCPLNRTQSRRPTVDAYLEEADHTFIDNASPIFYTLALLALGITLVRPHFYIGITAIIVALAVYGIRTTY
jgi:hypothetical protein